MAVFDQTTIMTRKKLVVIHGCGGSFVDALEGIRRLIRFDARFESGNYYVNRQDGMILRRLFQEPEPDRYTAAFQKLAVSRLLASCFAPGDVDMGSATEFGEGRLQRDFGHFGIPVGPRARQRRATQMEVEALTELESVMPVVGDLGNVLRDKDGVMLPEAAARQEIRARCQKAEDAPDLLPLLEMIRGMQETGGDLDTVASAVFYARSFIGDAAQHRQAIAYGRDWRFVFVNYHEGILHLATHDPAEVYMADVPIGALPKFDDEVKTLRRRGVFFRRFEDHHPFSAEQRDMLQDLERESIVGYVALSGPLLDQELEEEELRCGADMVYESCVKGQPWDGPEWDTLRRATHGEDFVTDRTPFGITLTELIKGGVCKVELAQALLADPREETFREVMAERGWDRLIDEWRTGFAAAEEGLWDNVIELTLARPEATLADAGGPALGPGSDVPVKPKERDNDELTMLMVRAYRPKPGEGKIPVGRVVEYFARQCPEADYFCYCYGAGLMVARRLNQADLSLNLGAIMPQIGGEGDGGHGGAAVCRPNANPRYPHRLLGTVTDRNFGQFCRYMRTRFADVGLPVKRMRDRSRASAGQQMNRGGMRLLLITLAAFLLGLGLILGSRAYRRDAIEKSNETFFPGVEFEADDAGAEDVGDAPDETGEEMP